MSSILKTLIAKQALADQAAAREISNDLKVLNVNKLEQENACLSQRLESALAQLKATQSKLALYEKDILKPEIRERLTLTKRNNYQRAYMRQWRAKRKLQQKQPLSTHSGEETT